jgi:hypothetical protein
VHVPQTWDEEFTLGVDSLRAARGPDLLLDGLDAAAGDQNTQVRLGFRARSVNNGDVFDEERLRLKKPGARGKKPGARSQEPEEN